MKVVVAMKALPWESFNIAVTGTDGTEGFVKAKSSATLAGFLPIYWSKEAAEAALPDTNFQEVDVADDWHPLVEALRKGAEAAEVSEEAAEASTDEISAD